MGLGDLLSDTIETIKETYSKYYKDWYDENTKKKLDIILNVMRTLREEADLHPSYFDVVKKEDENTIELLYQEINEKANIIQKIFEKTYKDFKDNYKWDEKNSKYIKNK